MNSLRREVDKLDKDLLDVLAKRRKIILKIVNLKKAKGFKIYDKERESSIFSSRGSYAEKVGLDPKFVKKLFKKIIKSNLK